MVTGLAAAGADLAALTTLLLLGAPTDPERRAARDAVVAAGASDDVVVLGAHAPSAARVLWGECRESATRGERTGYHTYPDLEVVQLVDPETGEQPAADDGRWHELVLTQLTFRGTALTRWRTGDLVSALHADDACPACGRTVPRVAADLRRGALVRPLSPRRQEAVRLDLRAVASAVVGRPEVSDWRVVLQPSHRDGTDELLVYVVAAADPETAVVAVARDIRSAAGQLPTQIVLAAPGMLPPAEPGALTRRVSMRPAQAAGVTSAHMNGD